MLPSSSRTISKTMVGTTFRSATSTFRQKKKTQRSAAANRNAEATFQRLADMAYNREICGKDFNPSTMQQFYLKNPTYLTIASCIPCACQLPSSRPSLLALAFRAVTPLATERWRQVRRVTLFGSAGSQFSLLLLQRAAALSFDASAPFDH